MTQLPVRLPEGRPGQMVAVLLLLLVLAATWSAVASPLLDLYEQNAQSLQTRRTLARRMAQIAATLPELQQQAASPAIATVPVLEGATDAVAGAELQQRVQSLATQAGAVLASAEILPAEPAGSYRRIALRVSVNAAWPILVSLLQAISTARPQTSPPISQTEARPTPGMIIDDLQLHGSRGFIRDKAAPLDATWTVFAFRPGAAP